MTDRVQAVKWESTSEGGTQNDEVPSEINPNEDGLDARSLFLQDDSSADSDVEITRDASGNLTFRDKVVTSPVSLETLADAGGGSSIIESKGIMTTSGGLVYTPGEPRRIKLVIQE